MMLWGEKFRRLSTRPGHQDATGLNSMRQIFHPESISCAFRWPDSQNNHYDGAEIDFTDRTNPLRSNVHCAGHFGNPCRRRYRSFRKSPSIHAGSGRSKVYIYSIRAVQFVISLTSGISQYGVFSELETSRIVLSSGISSKSAHLGLSMYVLVAVTLGLLPPVNSATIMRQVDRCFAEPSPEM